MIQANDVGDVRAVVRVLDLLRELNQNDASAISDLHRKLQLPKATVHRLLATLKSAGFVAVDAGSKTYRLTAKVLELSGGYTERSQLLEVSAPYLRQTTKKIRWPLAIGVLDNFNILVRFSTMPYSPLAVQATTVGHRLGLLESAMGNAYLAHCDEVQREILVETLMTQAQNPKAIQKLFLQKVDITRRQGYGLRLPLRNGESATIAVPIGQGKDILGVLGLTTFGRLMTANLLVSHQRKLEEYAQEILRRISASGTP
ncbi:helix-turn-helix domain-containing protein [Ottowia thiooxydans]|uniref:helix-turn-helix domain-containing protein n=1 Tax=Ottowia thiooxydans TaxID=219182 RepID=UPI0003FABC5F|nr:helix-turn-helix domain-containing protein [Ottowia thiooxydans]